jgi:hypothetical protein
MYALIVGLSSSLKLNGKPAPMPVLRSMTAPTRAELSTTSVATSEPKPMGTVLDSARSHGRNGMPSIVIQ